MTLARPMLDSYPATFRSTPTCSLARSTPSPSADRRARPAPTPASQRKASPSLASASGSISTAPTSARRRCGPSRAQHEYDANVTRALLEACRTACRACGDECEHHADHHEHCRLCAEPVGGASRAATSCWPPWLEEVGRSVTAGPAGPPPRWASTAGTRTSVATNSSLPKKPVSEAPGAPGSHA